MESLEYQELEHKSGIITSNIINGHYSDAKKQIRKLTKLELLDLIEHLRGYAGIPIHQVVSKLRNYLE